MRKRSRGKKHNTDGTLNLSTQAFVYESEKKKKEDRMTEVNYKEDAMIFHIFPVVLPKIEGIFQR